MFGKSRFPSEAPCSCGAEHAAEPTRRVGVMVRGTLDVEDGALGLGQEAQEEATVPDLWGGCHDGAHHTLGSWPPKLVGFGSSLGWGAAVVVRERYAFLSVRR